jgi:hypothetical protein
MVDQLKEIALKVGNINCVMTAQIVELQRKKDVLAKQLEEIESQLLNQVHKQELEQHQKHMEEKVLEFATHNESIIKEREQSRMKFFELKRRNS